jgi:hypothetical protein
VLAGDAGVVFKRFIVKAHLDYLGMAGKAPPPDVAAPTKTGA